MRCSLIVKGLLALEILEYNKTFGKSLGSFVNILARDCYAYCLDILVDLLCVRYLFCGGCTNILQGSDLLVKDCEDILHHLSVFQANRFIFQGVTNCVLCIELFSFK